MNFFCYFYQFSAQSKPNLSKFVQTSIINIDDPDKFINSQIMFITTEVPFIANKFIEA